MVQSNGTGFGRDQSVNGGVIMAGYWLKLYTEILDDPKYYRISDNAKLGMIELMVVAKKVDLDGGIPSIEDVAFYTRRTVEWWSPVFEELQKIEYLVVNNGETTIRTFAERQAPVSDAERMKQARAKKHKGEFDNNSTNGGYEVVTNRNGDSDTDTDTDTDENKDSISPVVETEYYEPYDVSEDLPVSIANEYKPKKYSDPRYKHIAYSVYYSVIGRRPSKEMVDDIIAVFGENPDVELVRECRKAWIQRGYSPVSYNWIYWYRDGIPEFAKKSGEPKGFRPVSENSDLYDVIQR